MTRAVRKLWSKACEPVDAASIAVFRIALGGLVAYDAMRKGDTLFNSNDGKALTFSYPGLFPVPSAGDWGEALGMLWLVAGLCVAVGFLYRPAIILVTGLSTFGFLQAAEYYLNHYYLLILICFLMCFVPANRAFAVDRLIYRRKRNRTAARLHLWLLKGQTEIVLLYAGLVKINPDWLRLEPLRTWLLDRQDRLWFGSIWEYDLAVAAAAYGVIALHVVGAPLLLWDRTRLPVFLLYCGFHLSNHAVFDIGIFPWMTIAMSTLFFVPDWPRRILRHAPVLPSAACAGRSLRPLGLFAVVWLALQVVIPLRHYTIPGDVAWTYEAHRFSWRMKLVDRWSPGMTVVAWLPEKDLLVIPSLSDLLSDRQGRKVATRPDLARQIGPQLAERLRADHDVTDVRVHLYMPVGYNNRQAQVLVDPTQNIAAASVPESWILRHNETPLRRREDVRLRDPSPLLPDVIAAMGLPSPVECAGVPTGKTLCSTKTRLSDNPMAVSVLGLGQPAAVELH